MNEALPMVILYALLGAPTVHFANTDWYALVLFALSVPACFLSVIGAFSFPIGNRTGQYAIAGILVLSYLVTPGDAQLSEVGRLLFYATFPIGMATTLFLAFMDKD
ncbi:MAG: hypothetical protein HQL35_05730 [Alphaproteobacteria bacterium]|nr:hypothetical protein [Alphaproteobacteria bacterium]